MKKNIIRWIVIIVAVILAFTAGIAVAGFAKDGSLTSSFSGIIDALFSPKDIDVPIEGETENVPHAPGGKDPVSEPDNTTVTPGFVIYYDTERYVMTEENGVTYIRFELDGDLPPCEMEIRHVPNTTPAAAAESARTQMLSTWPTVSEISPVEKPAGLHFSVSSGMQWNSAWENVYFVSDGQNGCFRIISRYFVEAAEGHGARFRAMLQTFEVVDPS